MNLRIEVGAKEILLCSVLCLAFGENIDLKQSSWRWNAEAVVPKVTAVKVQCKSQGRIISYRRIAATFSARRRDLPILSTD